MKESSSPLGISLEEYSAGVELPSSSLEGEEFPSGEINSPPTKSLSLIVPGPPGFSELFRYFMIPNHPQLLDSFHVQKVKNASRTHFCVFICLIISSFFIYVPLVGVGGDLRFSILCGVDFAEEFSFIALKAAFSAAFTDGGGSLICSLGISSYFGFPTVPY